MRNFLLIPLLATAFTLQAEPLPSDEHFKVETVAKGLSDAMEIAVIPATDAKAGSIFVIERTGAVKLVDPGNHEATTLLTLEVALREGEYARESGLLGITLDPAFPENQHVFLFYSRPDVSVQRLSRWTFDGVTLAEETVILEFEHDRENAVCHEGGSLAFGPDGNLYLSTGDNTCPFKSSGYGPIDEREERRWYDAQRSAANTNDLRGKILRITPLAEGSYDIPEGNLFPEGTPNTRAEIYAMGCRNPFRMSIDSRTGFVYWGEVGPDAAKDTDRGPSGYDEINQARKPGYFGWPYFIADNQSYADYNFATETIVKAVFDPKQPVNDSPNNSGLQSLPAATPPLWHYPRASACAGPVYHQASFPANPGRLPDAFDNALLVYDWTSAWLRVLKLDENGEDVLSNEPWLSRHLFVHPVDMETGNNGEIWILEYGSAWYDGSDGALKKITYSETPIPLSSSHDDPRMSGLDLEHPGAKLLASSTCLACHMTRQKSLGPTYEEVAKKYQDDDTARDTLAEKILTGGMGAWGNVPMPPHPQHNIEETQQMIDAILAIKPRKEHD